MGSGLVTSRPAPQIRPVCASRRSFFGERTPGGIDEDGTGFTDEGLFVKDAASPRCQRARARDHIALPEQFIEPNLLR